MVLVIALVLATPLAAGAAAGPTRGASPLPLPPQSQPSPAALAALGLPSGLVRAVGSAVAADVDDVAEVVLRDGCPRHLLGSDAFPFHEAQFACVAFTGYALVNRRVAAGGSASEDEVATLHELLQAALAAANKQPFAKEKRVQVDGRSLPYSGLYRGGLLLLLAGMTRVGAADEEATRLFDALAHSLAADYGKVQLLPSFGHLVWPCDNAPAAAALALHGRLRDSAESQQAGAMLAQRLETLAQRKRGFPTRVGEDGSVIEALPRGTVLGWTSAFLATGGLAMGQKLGSTLVRDFCDKRQVEGVELAACREWPRGVHKQADAVSGPIIQGYGVGASALAVAATGAIGEQAWHEALVDTAHKVGVDAILAAPKQYPLEGALWQWAVSVRAW